MHILISVYWFPSLCRIKSKVLKVALKFFSLLLFFFFNLASLLLPTLPTYLAFSMVNVGALSRGGRDDIDYLRHNLEVTSSRVTDTLSGAFCGNSHWSQ